MGVYDVRGERADGKKRMFNGRSVSVGGRQWVPSTFCKFNIKQSLAMYDRF